MVGVFTFHTSGWGSSPVKSELSYHRPKSSMNVQMFSGESVGAVSLLLHAFQCKSSGISVIFQ